MVGLPCEHINEAILKKYLYSPLVIFVTWEDKLQVRGHGFLLEREVILLSRQAMCGGYH